jgi:SAM-dependent methyltransferase
VTIATENPVRGRGIPYPADPAPVAPPVSLVTQLACGYAASLRRRPVALLRAGAAPAPASGLDLDLLRAACGPLTIGLVDDGSPAARAAAAGQQGLSTCAQGDLRTVPLRPRSYDIVDCCLLLHRIEHTELVLDRLAGALRPGGLLLLRVVDRASAAGFLDRALPPGARRSGWRRRRPGEPGPYPAVYEPLTTARGITSYAARRGLVIARRDTLAGPAAGRRPARLFTARRAVAWLSRGRLTAAHDELIFAIRRPEESSARLL